MTVARTNLIVAVAALPASAGAQLCGDPWSLHEGPGPAARLFHSTTYDSARGKVILFGGYNFPTYFNDTWEWTAAGPGGGGSWSLRATSGPPVPFGNAPLAYDSSRQKAVLLTFVGPQAQTWEWDGTVWEQVQVVSSPPSGGLLAYDSARQRTVLFGSAATFEYDGATWVQAPDPTPTLSDVNSMTFDAARSRMVLLAGEQISNTWGTSTWEREPSGWIRKNFGSVPHTSDISGATYDPAHAQVTFVQTVDSQTFVPASIWAYDGLTSTWHVVSSGGPDLANNQRSIAFDHAGGQLVFFGGTVGRNETDKTWLARSDVRSGPTVTDVGTRQRWFTLHDPPIVLTVGSTTPATIRWRRDGVPLSDGSTFSGTTTTQLTINPREATSGSYDAVVTDDCGSPIRPATRLYLTCYANCDGAVGLTASDFICFLMTYSNGSSYANCDQSTIPPVLNANDFVCFLSYYTRACH
jgi:hypothetical protein